jgi:hypothetical protein
MGLLVTVGEKSQGAMASRLKTLDFTLRDWTQHGGTRLPFRTLTFHNACYPWLLGFAKFFANLKTTLLSWNQPYLVMFILFNTFLNSVY